MIKAALIAALLGTAALVPLGARVVAAGATTSEDIVRQLFDKAVETYKAKGFAPTGWSYISTLKEGSKERVTVSLSGSSQYSVIGACDTDCGNIDIHMYDSNGNEVDKDVEKDDFPIVATTKSGTFTLEVSMVACSSAPCSYGLKAFGR